MEDWGKGVEERNAHQRAKHNSFESHAKSGQMSKPSTQEYSKDSIDSEHNKKLLSTRKSK